MDTIPSLNWRPKRRHYQRYCRGYSIVNCIIFSCSTNPREVAWFSDSNYHPAISKFFLIFLFRNLTTDHKTARNSYFVIVENWTTLCRIKLVSLVRSASILLLTFLFFHYWNFLSRLYCLLQSLYLLYFSNSCQSCVTSEVHTIVSVNKALNCDSQCRFELWIHFWSFFFKHGVDAFERLKIRR